MAESEAQNAGSNETMVVRTHVTPWGFIVALPLALAFAYLGARALDAGLVPNSIPDLDEAPIWLFSALLIGFALFLFLVGIGELASFMKPAVEVVLDRDGIAAHGMLGKRQMAWRDLVEVRTEGGQLALRARTGNRASLRTMRLHFNRLAIDPVVLISRIGVYRPDLARPYLSALSDEAVVSS